MILVLLLGLLAGLFGVQPQGPGKPVPIGVGPRYHPPPGAHAVGGLRCTRRAVPRYGVHLELFADGRVVVVPAGIGIAPPRRRQGAYVLGGRCSFPVQTHEPTGLLEVSRPGLTLGQFYAIWGRRIPAGARVYVSGLRWPARPAAVPLSWHAEIVVEIEAYVRPHSFYRFPKGL
jgi:hypothetical protein